MKICGNINNNSLLLLFFSRLFDIHFFQILPDQGCTRWQVYFKVVTSKLISETWHLQSISRFIGLKVVINYFEMQSPRVIGRVMQWKNVMNLPYILTQKYIFPEITCCIIESNCPFDSFILNRKYIEKYQNVLDTSYLSHCFLFE